MKKNLIYLFSSLLIASNLHASSTVQNKFDQLHNLQTQNNNTDENVFKTWVASYSKIEGSSKHCDDTLRIEFNANRFYINSWSRDSVMTRDVLVHAFDGENQSTATRTASVKSGLFSWKQVKQEVNYQTKQINSKEIELNVKYGKNDFDLKLKRVNDEQIQLEVDDHTSFIKVISYDRIKSRFCSYQKN
ncbi:hypothetical protein MJH12_18335 [bacterium]|nr:hypothetical protein [bacterium]